MIEWQKPNQPFRVLRGGFSVLWKGTMDDQETKPVTERFKAGDILSNGEPFDPEKHRILKNGVVQDIQTGRFVTAPAPEHAPITLSNAKAVAKKRWDASREAFAAGVARGLVGREDAPIEAWQKVGEKAAELLNDAKSARGFADLARFTGEAGGFVPMARGREEMQEPGQGEQPAVFVLFAQLINQIAPPAQDSDVIEGEVSD